MQCTAKQDNWKERVLFLAPSSYLTTIFDMMQIGILCIYWFHKYSPAFPSFAEFVAVLRILASETMKNLDFKGRVALVWNRLRFLIAVLRRIEAEQV